MLNKKWLASILPYLVVWAGLFLFKSAWLALIGLHLAILIAVLIASPETPINLLFKSKYKKWILASIFFCGLSGINLYFFWDLFGIYGNLPAQLASIGLNSSSWLPFIAYFSLVNPFVEEYFWRGLLGSAAKKLHISDFVYAGYHAIILWGKIQPISILLALVFLTTAGWLWRQINREDKGMLASALGHLAADFTILACVYLQTNIKGL